MDVGSQSLSLNGNCWQRKVQISRSSNMVASSRSIAVNGKITVMGGDPKYFKLHRLRRRVTASQYVGFYSRPDRNWQDGGPEY